jgi:hypothetical protein
MIHVKSTQLSLVYRLIIGIIAIVAVLVYSSPIAKGIENPKSGGVGLQGSISAPPPTRGATITSPSNGAVFTTLPVTVTGYCPGDILVKMFKNNVFSGSVPCERNSYSIKIDLFSSRNDLVARVYDELDQAGPDSNLVQVTFNDNAARSEVAARISLTSNYARRGANPGEILTWPIIISGGTVPYALSVDWGDGTASDVYTVTTPGETVIKHKFEQSGVYRALIKAADKNGAIAYLQLTAIGNGDVKQANVAGATADKTAIGKTVVLWQPAAIAIPLILTTFWLGKRYEVKRIKTRLRHGEHPFEG